MLTWNTDFAKGLVGLLGNDKAIGEVFHITSDEVLTWNQIFLEVYQALDLEPNVIHISSEMIVRHDPEKLGTLLGDKVNSVVFDNRKIKRFVPEFSCEVNWAQGLRRSLDWFESHPKFQTIDKEMNARWDNLISRYDNVFPQ